MTKKAQAALSAADSGNAIAAWVILQNPAKYEGLPLEWAQLWTEGTA